MSKIYLPSSYLNKPCYLVNNDYIRVYSTTNSQNNVVYDIYFKNDYMIKQGTASYSTSTQCDRINTYTDVIYYRYDFDKILITLLIFCIFTLLIPLKVILRLFRRFR